VISGHGITGKRYAQDIITLRQHWITPIIMSKSTMIKVGDKQISNAHISRETKEEISKLSNTPEWQAALLRLHSDPVFAQEQLKLLDEDIDSQIENNND
jgi:tripartite-type tricarboxylate transporter receptor subunit TctC